MPTTTTQTNATRIEMATYLKEYKERDAKENIDAALKQLHSMLDDIEREAQRPSNSLEQVLYHIRHEMAWKYANISSTLDRVDGALREVAIANMKLELLEVL
jgi:hypothetical protein